MTSKNKPNCISFALLIATALITGCSTNRIVVKDAGLSAPECVIHYEDEDVYLASNINGSPVAADGNGFVSKINPDGSVKELKWIDGAAAGVTLNAPKGMAVLEGKLFVGDVAHVQIFDIKSGKQIASVKIKEASFLNDVAAGKDAVYVTDTGLNFEDGKFTSNGTDGVFKVRPDGKYEVVASDTKLGQPNGVMVDGDDILLACWGSGKVLRIDPKGKRSELPKPPKGMLDGIFRTKDGTLMVNSQADHEIYTLKRDGTYSLFAGNLDPVSDMAYDAKRHRLIQAHAPTSTLTFIPLP
jgi:sugar lactone lactonase YvrE